MTILAPIEYKSFYETETPQPQARSPEKRRGEFSSFESIILFNFWCFVAVYVVAMYDYKSQGELELDLKAGDKIQ